MNIERPDAYVIRGLYRGLAPELVFAEDETAARALYHKEHPGMVGTIFSVEKVEPEADEADDGDG